MKGVVVVLTLEGAVKRAKVLPNLYKIGGTRPFMNIHSQVLGLGWSLGWLHGADVYYEVSKAYSFRSHTGLWDHNITQVPRGAVIDG